VRHCRHSPPRVYPVAPRGCDPGVFPFLEAIVNRCAFLVDGLNLYHSAFDAERATRRRWGTLGSIFPAVRVRPHRRGFLLRSSGCAREQVGGATGRRLPGLPERLSPRPRCVLLSRCFREPGPGRSTCSRPSAGGPLAWRPPRGCSCLPRSPQSASRPTVVRRVSAADGQAGQPRWWTRDGDIARSALPTRMAEASRPGEGHRRGTRRRLRYDGRPPSIRRGHPVLQRHGPGPGAGGRARVAAGRPTGVRSRGLGCTRRTPTVAVSARGAPPASPACGSGLPFSRRSYGLHSR
jgi:hypothetical protein